jgi:hypothetical protein
VHFARAAEETVGEGDEGIGVVVVELAEGADEVLLFLVFGLAGAALVGEVPG